MGDEMVFEFFAVPHTGVATENIDRALVAVVLVGLAPCAGRDGGNLQTDAPAPTDWAEMPGAYKCPLLPVNSAPAPTIRHTGVLSSLAPSVISGVILRLLQVSNLVGRHLGRSDRGLVKNPAVLLAVR
jgi:hypothetical protein